MGVIRFTFAKWQPDDNPIWFTFWKKCKSDGGAIRLTFAKQNDNRMTLPSGCQTLKSQKSPFAVNSLPITKLTILINNTTHKLLININ